MCINPQTNRAGLMYKCGKCKACHTTYVQHWTFRIQQEMRKTHRGVFVTLTYDYANIPMYKGKFTLYKKDYQDFLKRLRKSLSLHHIDIKYLCCGEYGSKNNRPHYHLIMTGIDSSYYDAINAAWGKGHVHVGTVEPASIAYTLKYAIKGDTKERDWRQQKQFVAMSKGIGEEFAFNIAHVKYTGTDKNGNSFVRYRKIRTPKPHFSKKLDTLLQMPYYKVNGFKMSIPRFYLTAAGYDTTELGELYKDKMQDDINNIFYKDYNSRIGFIQVKGSIESWYRSRKFTVSKEKL